MIGDNYRQISPFDRWVFDASGNLAGASASNLSGNEARFLTADQATAVQSLVSAPGIPGTAHPRYFTHLFAGNQLADDPKVYDISGALGHATPEADLSLSALWTTTPGYASTLDPTTTVGQKLRRLMLPVLMWDWAGGESLFIWGLVKAAFEAAACSFMGNNIGGSAENGFRIRVSTAGKLVLAMQQGTTYSYSSTASTLSAFDGALHSFGIWMDAAARKAYTYVDETLQVGGATVAAMDTLPTAAQIADTSAQLRLGGEPSATGGVSSGLATAIRALAIIKFAPTDTVPTTAQVLAAQAALRAAPHLTIARGTL